MGIAYLLRTDLFLDAAMKNSLHMKPETSSIDKIEYKNLKLREISPGRKSGYGKSNLIIVQIKQMSIIIGYWFYVFISVNLMILYMIAPGFMASG